MEARRYAMSLHVATTISGIDSVAVLRQNLAIARGFVDAHSGKLTAENRDGGGARFTIDLPVRVTDANALEGST